MHYTIRIMLLPSFSNLLIWLLCAFPCQTYGAEVSKWTTEQIISAAGIVTGLSGDEISSLSLNDLTAIQAVGSNGLWSVDQVIY